MKITSSKDGKQTVKINRKEWESIGKKAGWMKISEIDDNKLVEAMKNDLKNVSLKIQKFTRNLAIFKEIVFDDMYPTAILEIPTKSAVAHLELTSDEYYDSNGVITFKNEYSLDVNSDNGHLGNIIGTQKKIAQWIMSQLKSEGQNYAQ